MNNETKYYFAYGLNMDKAEMLYHCPNAEFQGTAVLPNCRFALDSEGYATIIPSRSSSAEVLGALWRINTEDEKKLDICEGVDHGYYSKVSTKVITKGSNSEVSALVYFSLRGENTGARDPEYMQRLVSAAEKQGLDRSYCGVLKDIWIGYANDDYRFDPEYIKNCIRSSRKIIEDLTKKECEETPGFKNMSPEEKEILHDEIYKRISRGICIDFKGFV